MQWAIIFFIIFTCSQFYQIRDKKVEIKRIVDGDTLKLSSHSRVIICRLYAVDAPEMNQTNFAGQKIGQQSYEALKNLIEHKSCLLRVKAIGVYGRKICQLHCEGVGDIALFLLTHGHVIPWMASKNPMYYWHAFKALKMGHGFFKQSGFLVPKYYRQGPLVRCQSRI